MNTKQRRKGNRMIPGGSLEWDDSVLLPCNDEEIDVTVYAEVEDFFPAKTYGPPESCHSAEGGSVTIQVFDKDGKDVTKLVTQKQIQKWEDEASQRVDDNYRRYDYDGD